MEEKRLYILIYGYLLTRIRYGFYPKGEHLPSIHKLSHLFGVSTMAVRKAVQLLEQKGYITTIVVVLAIIAVLAVIIFSS